MDIRASLELTANGVAASVAVVGATARARSDRVVVAVCFGRSDAWTDSTAKHRLAKRTGSRQQASSIRGANHVPSGTPTAAAGGSQASTGGVAAESVAAVA